MIDYTSWIGKKVLKVSKNKKDATFKSGLHVNTVKDLVVHPKLDVPAFTFYEDDSCVDVKRCKLLTLEDVIVLDGIVGDVPTGDECDYVIGVLHTQNTVTFAGEKLVNQGSGFPLSKEMANRIGFGTRLASVKIVTSPSPIDVSKINEMIVKSIYGQVSARYYHRYSDITGYLWTEANFVVGGHDIPDMLHTFKGEYIHMEIELYGGLS